ncbi:hypothetical protein [Pedobacter nyackensis]|uniref:hypothetical protein n=1 Tax=Pedobacter nyackensis TaxID=475255 RepID=UPI00292D7711|nr:hypothetical protein [Pedobacter nyackensis]
MVGYGIKYKCEFTSIKGLDYKIYILQKEYDSAIYDLRMGGNPIQINYTNGSENKFEIIRGSECVLNFFSEYDGQFAEIMYADKNDFLVQILLNDELHWQGYIIQDNYNEPFASAPYPMSLRATDGLGDLKLIDFAQENGSIFLNNMTFVEVIINCLSLLNNGAELVTSNDVFEARIDRNVATNEAFNSLTVNPFVFLKNELNVKKCDEVIRSILELFQCYIYYKGGKYHIERINYKINETISRRTYNINFNGEQSILPVFSTENIRGKIERNGLLSFINNDQNSTFAAAYNKVKTESSIIPPLNLVINNYLRHWDDTANVPLYFNKLGTVDIAKVPISRSGDALWIKDRVADADISYSTNMLTPVKTSFQGGLSTGQDSLNIKVAHRGNTRFIVKVTTPTSVHYLNSSGYTESGVVGYDAWFTTTPSNVKFSYFGAGRLPIDDEISWEVDEVEVLLPLGTTDITFGLMPSYFLTGTDSSACYIREFTPTIKAGVAARSNGDTYQINSIKNNNETYEDFNPFFSEFNNAGLSNQILINTPTGRTYTKIWYRDGKAENKALLQIGIQSILNQYRTPFRLFSGSFFGEFDYTKVYEIETLQGLHMPYKVNSDLKFDTHRVDFFELLNDADSLSDKYKRFENFKDGEYTAYEQKFFGSTSGGATGGDAPVKNPGRPRRGGSYIL